MANSPFIQFPCGEWAPGYGPEDAPCDPLIPGDCDDVDVRVPTCDDCGPPCPDCCVPDQNGDGCKDIEPIDPPTEEKKEPPGPGPGGPGAVGPGGGGGGGEICIELCPCETEGGGGADGCITYVGQDLVDQVMEYKEPSDGSEGCDVVILGGVEGDAGGGCQKIVSGPTPGAVDPTAGTEWCEICPCWEIKDPEECDPPCANPANQDPSAITNNINNGSHCPEEFEEKCCPDDCEQKCDPVPMATSPPCPGCKPFDAGAGKGPGEGGGGPSDCHCEIAMSMGGPAKSGGDSQPTPGGVTISPPSCETTSGEECDKKACMDPPNSGTRSCDCCDCKIVITFPQRCVEDGAGQHEEQGDLGKSLAEQTGKALADGIKSNSECAQQGEGCDTDPDCCFEESVKDCTWHPPPGGPCECSDASGSDQDGMGETGESPPCPDAKYECCWDEVYCKIYTWDDEDDDEGPTTPRTDDDPDPKCKCVLNGYEGDVGEDADCPDPPCCAPGCTPEQKCRGTKAEVTLKFKCVQVGEDKNLNFCSISEYARPKCECNGECDDVEATVYAYCSCKGGPSTGGGLTEAGGPCDEAGSSGRTHASEQGGPGPVGGIITKKDTVNPNDTLISLNHESGGFTYEWDKQNQVFRDAGLEIPEGIDPNPGGSVQSVEYERPKGTPFSMKMDSEFQVGHSLRARSKSPKRVKYEGGFDFKPVEATTIQTRKTSNPNINLRSIVTTVVHQPFKSVYNFGTDTPRSEREVGSRNIYDPKLNLFTFGAGTGWTPVANDKWRTIFSTSVHKGIKDVLDHVNSSDTWDEAYITNISMFHIHRSLNPRLKRIIRQLQYNNLYGFTKIDLLRTIKIHLLKNTFDQFDIDFYENFVPNQASQHRFAVNVKNGTVASNKILAIQMAIANAKPIGDTTSLGINAKLSTMYRIPHVSKNSRIPVISCEERHTLALNSGNELPIMCADGTVAGLLYGTASESIDSTVFEGVGCTSELRVTSEEDHFFRLNMIVREKVLALMGVTTSEYMYSETPQSSNVENESELNLDGNNPLQEYYVVVADYPSTITQEYYNDSPYLIQTTRTYKLETDTTVVRDVIQNQLSKIVYADYDDKIFSHLRSSEELSYTWVDFTLKNLGLSENSSVPILTASEFPYIILIPTALSENNPFYISSDLQIVGDYIRRTLKLALHIDRRLLTSVTAVGNILEVNDDGT